MHIKNTELKIIKADITELEIDAIVNAANNKLVMGGGDEPLDISQRIRTPNRPDGI